MKGGCRTSAKEEFKLLAGHKHFLLSTQLVNDALQGLTTNVCGDYCVFYVFYVQRVRPLDLVFLCCTSWGIASMTGTIVCVRFACPFLELLIMIVFMFLL